MPAQQATPGRCHQCTYDGTYNTHGHTRKRERERGEGAHHHTPSHTITHHHTPSHTNTHHHTLTLTPPGEDGVHSLQVRGPRAVSQGRERWRPRQGARCLLLLSHPPCLWAWAVWDGQSQHLPLDTAALTCRFPPPPPTPSAANAPVRRGGRPPRRVSVPATRRLARYLLGPGAPRYSAGAGCCGRAEASVHFPSTPGPLLANARLRRGVCTLPGK